MGRKKTNTYNTTAFGRRIALLQEQHGYKDHEVISRIVDEHGATLINDAQTYSSYKTGKRKTPRDFDVVLTAFARFYGVTTDYLLELDDAPNPQVKSVQDATGLSEGSVRNLMLYNKSYPNVMRMIDILLADISGEDSAFFISLYNQIYDDYKDVKSAITDSSYDLRKIEHRFMLTQQMYNHIKMIVTEKMEADFDKQILIDEDLQNYYNSQEFIDTIPSQPYTVTGATVKASIIPTEEKDSQ